MKLAFGTFAAALLAATSAHAVVCSGTTQTVNSGDAVSGSFLLVPGNCVAAGDKVFGQFTVAGDITGAGNSSFSWIFNPGSVTLGFAGVVSPDTNGSIDYKVAVDAAGVAAGFAIVGLQKDFTLNTTGTGSATLTGFTDPVSIDFSCTRTLTTSTCPQTAMFPATDTLSVDESIAVTGPAFVTAITDTIIQAQAVPEPSSILLLGAGLLGLGWAVRRRQRHSAA